MALAIERREGEYIQIGGERIRVSKIHSPTRCRIELSDGRQIELATDEPVEVLPEVRIRVGKRGQNSMTRLEIDAPKSLHISRD